MESKIKQIIIVEGAHDVARLASFIDADFIKTDGTSFPPATRRFIMEARRQGRKFIIFTDPDAPGEQIRKEAQKLVPEAKHAFVNADQARKKNKVGVEHASQEEIIAALNGLCDFSRPRATISRNDLFDLGLLGRENSALKRAIIEKKLRIGHGTAKTFFKRLNLLGIKANDLSVILKENSLWEK